MHALTEFGHAIVTTARDVLPALALLLIFQLVVLRRPLPHWRRVLAGFVFTLLGLVLFLDGLELTLFPVGRIMAEQLSAPEFVFGTATAPVDGSWTAYGWVLVFAALIGFATTIAEPSLIAVALKAHEVSHGGISQWGLRLAVAVGVGLGVSIGCVRIVTGAPLVLFIITGYAVVVVQTIFAPREIIPLAYDSGGVTTSTVTVPLVAALGLGLAEAVPGRNALLDGFGLIAFASVLPMITVMGYAQLARLLAERGSPKREGE